MNGMQCIAMIQDGGLFFIAYFKEHCKTIYKELKAYALIIFTIIYI